MQILNIPDVTDNGILTKAQVIEDALSSETGQGEHCQDAEGDDANDTDTESVTGMEEGCDNLWCEYGKETDGTCVEQKNVWYWCTGVEKKNVWYCTKCSNDSQTLTVCNNCLEQYGHHQRHKNYLKSLAFS